MNAYLFDRNIAAIESRNSGLAARLNSLAGQQDLDAASLDMSLTITDTSSIDCSVFKDRIVMVIGLESLLAVRDIQGFPPEGCRLVLYEEDEGLFSRVLHAVELSGIVGAENTDIYMGEPELERIKNDVGNLIVKYTLHNILILDREVHSVDDICMFVALLPPERKYLVDHIMSVVTEFKSYNAMVMTYSNARHATKELAEFLGIDPVAATPDVMRGMYLLTEDWKSSSPKTAEDIHRWYCETPYYLNDLCFYHATSGNYKKTVEIVMDACAARGGDILDFGGGDGDLVIRLKQIGLNVTYCDVPGRTMEYALWRFERRGLSVPLIVSSDPNTITLPHKFDIIIALDVLEHLVNPIHYCAVFYNELSPGGMLIAKPSFSDESNKTHPMHLMENSIYNETFDAEMEKIGFRKTGEHNEFVSLWIKPE